MDQYIIVTLIALALFLWGIIVGLVIAKIVRIGVKGRLIWDTTQQPARMAYEERLEQIEKIEALNDYGLDVFDVLKLDAENGWIEKEKKQ